MIATTEAPEPNALLSEARAERINIKRRHVAQILLDALTVGRMTRQDMLDLEEKAEGANIPPAALTKIVEKLSKHFELKAAVPDVAKLWSDHVEHKQALAAYDAETRTMCEAVYNDPRAMSRSTRDIEADVQTVHQNRAANRRPLVEAHNKSAKAWQEADDAQQKAHFPRADVEEFCNKLRGR